MPVRREKGHTLVEILVVIAIFGVVMTLMTASFSRMVAGSGQVVKSAETEIGGLIGLELFRVDLGFAGFGLPWSLQGASYLGEANSYRIDGKAYLDVAQFNDASTQGAPRPFVLLNDKGMNGSDHLVLKGSALGWSGTARSWSYLNYSSTAPQLKTSKSEVELTPGSGDRVIVVNSRIRNGMPVKELVRAGEIFSISYPGKGQDIATTFRPGIQDRYLVYGIAGKEESKVSFPFNRADYYLAVPGTRSAACAPGTGVLYRGSVKQESGEFWSMPILDCVADLQVLFVLDGGDGIQYSNDLALETLNSLYMEESHDAAESIRRHVREVRVYLLAQEGKLDRDYTYPQQRIVVGDPRQSSYLSVWDATRLAGTFGREWMHYRWKVYSIVAQPRNSE